MVPQAFTGRPPFGELTAPVITSQIMDGKRPARPREAQGLSLTDSVWDMTVRCWDQDPAQRLMTTEVVQLLREWPVSSLPPRNYRRDVAPAATVFLLCRLKSRISQPSFSSTGFYPSVKPRMFFRSVAPTSSSLWSQMATRSGDKGWLLVTTLQGRRLPERVAGNQETHEFSFGGA